MDVVEKIAEELSLRPEQVASTLSLLADEATIPFIARYRKERTGSLDEEKLRAIRDRHAYLRGLEQRRRAVLRTIEAQGKLTGELRTAIEACETYAEIEDLYLPFKPRRRTRASEARERGLEPLARAIYEQADPEASPEELAAAYVNPEKGVPDARAAQTGAGDIIAEWIAENATVRRFLRTSFLTHGIFRSRVADPAKDKKSKFTVYYEFEAPVAKIASHAMLAMRRGERQSVLKISLEIDEGPLLEHIAGQIIRDPTSPYAAFLRDCVRDAYERLLKGPIGNQVRSLKKRKADEEAIRTFARNLRNLLLAPPAGPRVVLGIDPGIRTGAKVAVVDGTGRALEYATMYLHPPRQDRAAAAHVLRDLSQRRGAELVAIGNGTGSRETDEFVTDLLALLPEAHRPGRVIVNEAGASVYSASALARTELPGVDVALRGAVSIARRLQDPLAELVKIEARSIGVGQYQHDVDQRLLARALDGVVESCVNAVGVDVNTASAALLRYVSGIGPSLASAIVEFRNEQGPFRSREELKKIPRFGEKTFEQAAGFLRVRGGENALDASAVHPESYPIVEAMARDLGVGLGELAGNDAVLDRITLRNYVGDSVGMETLRDIIAELRKPGRDPRATFRCARFDAKIREIQDLQVGMRLEGIVTNVTDFGAFVDIGVHQDGLVHISQLRDGFVRNPEDVVRVGEVVTVRVLAVDVDKRRISLTMRNRPEGRRGSGERRRARRKRSQRGARRRIDAKSALQELLDKWGDPYQRKKGQE